MQYYIALLYALKIVQNRVNYRRNCTKQIKNRFKWLISEFELKKKFFRIRFLRQRKFEKKTFLLFLWFESRDTRAE